VRIIRGLTAEGRRREERMEFGIIFMREGGEWHNISFLP
jgi:hypothetical protein